VVSVSVHSALRDAALDVPALLGRVGSPSAGGQALFLGTVRDHDDGRPVTALDYEAHPSAALVLREVAEQIAAAFELRAVAVEHRVGVLGIGDVAVVCAVSADHRGPALEACRALIDTVKERVPIWKRQHHPDGTSAWVACP